MKSQTYLDYKALFKADPAKESYQQIQMRLIAFLESQSGIPEEYLPGVKAAIAYIGTQAKHQAARRVQNRLDIIFQEVNRELL